MGVQGVPWLSLGQKGWGAVPGHATPSLPLQEKLLEDSYSPVMLAKAVKNVKEQEMLRAAHVRTVPVPAVLSSSGGQLGEAGC